MENQNNKIVTVFTPTYNRAYLLPRAYAALKRQTCKNFVWLIVDDGSTDNTKDLIRQWMTDENEFEVKYVYKENGGLQSGYVEALKYIDTELAGCIDSDAYLVDDAIESIIKRWKDCDDDKIAGVMGLDAYEDGRVIGGLFNEDDPEVINIIDWNIRKKRKADRVFFIKSDIYKSATPAKRYAGEKTMNASYLLIQIAEKYDFAVINKPLCIAIYDENGLTAQGWRRYFMRPNTYADWRIFLFQIPNTPCIFKAKNTIHYIAECIIAGRKHFLKETPFKLMTLCLIPVGYCYYLHLLVKKKNDLNKSKVIS